MSSVGMQVPFGAVYFRKSNPPREDWDRDYTVAGEDGLNIFRHWFMWSAIERSPGQYDWEEYDRQLDLAAQNGIKTIIAELIHSVPDWAVRKFGHARQIRSDGTALSAIMGVSSATGGFANNGGGAGVLTLNCPEVREAAGNFLTALASRYKGHPGLLGYDVWNECNYSPDVDFSSFTKAKYRDWLKDKYGSLEALGAAWYRYSYSEWDDIEPPSQVAPYPENLDWLSFKRDDFYSQMQWRIDTIRNVDADCLIAAHGVAGAISDMAARGCDDWLAASKVELYGYTWIAARKGSQAWHNFYGGDLTRAASRGKPFWHAERQGGPLWLQPQVVGRDKEDGRVAEPKDIRLWTFSSFAAGAKGVLNLRWRPLLDGPLFGAFGSYGMDGSRTPRSEMASKIAKWANLPEQEALFKADPVKGDIGILVVPETQQYDYLLNYNAERGLYTEAMWGAYRGFFDNNIQADWVHIEDIDAYDVIYYPYPIMFTKAQGEKLSNWVAKGGTLICEACPGYFGDRGRVGTTQPNHGLDVVLGAREDEVEFMPDIGDRIKFEFDGLDLQGGGFLQSYMLAGGEALGRFSDGRIAVVGHRFKKGRTLLIGTNPSVGYYKFQTPSNRDFFANVLKWTGRTPRVVLDNTNVQGRLHEGDGKVFVWLINSSRQPQTTSVSLDGRADVEIEHCHWGSEATTKCRNVTIAARDAAIFSLVCCAQAVPG